MSARQVCTQRYSFQLNYVRNIENTLTTADRLKENETSKNRDSENRDSTISSVTVRVKDLRIFLASALSFHYMHITFFRTEKY